MERYTPLTEFKDITFYAKNVAAAHDALQDLEAGVEFTPLKQASALFQFLCAMTYYPFSVRNGDSKEDIQVENLSMVMMDDGGFGVVFHGFKENGDAVTTPPCGILGPGSDFSDYWLTTDEVMELIEVMFPDVVVTNSTMVSAPPDYAPLHHVSMRPHFMQPKNAHYPLPSGTAVSENLPLALMQAAVRMLGGLVAVDAANLATKTLLERNKAAQKKEPAPRGSSLGDLYKEYESQLEQRITEILNKKFGI